MRETPLKWRRAWQLHRAMPGLDSHGDPVRTYDMDSPDLVGADGESSGVCWQIGIDNTAVEAYGERPIRSASFVLYDGAVKIAPFDRCVFGDGVWEVTAVTPWLHHRLVTLEAVR